MFSDDFWSESDPSRKGPAQTALGSFFKRIVASVRTILAVKQAPEHPSPKSLGDYFTLPEELSTRPHHRAGHKRYRHGQEVD